MRTRFGVHTGDAVVGNVGSVDRINYTALGHTVNMASRFEKLNKRYGTTILVSEDVRSAAGESFVFRFVDRVVPDGAHMAMALYELVGAEISDEPDLMPATRHRDTQSRWLAAWSACDSQEWKKAYELLEQLAADEPDDALFQVYLARCEAHRKLAPREA